MSECSLSRMQSLSESRGGSKVTKRIFSSSAKRYYAGYERHYRDVMYLS